MFMTRKLIVGLIALSMIAACGPKKRVQREKEPGKAEELSGNWSAVDAQETSEAIIKDCFGQGWLDKAAKDLGREPKIRVRGIVNKTDEHIDAQVFIKNLEKAMVNSGKVSVLAQEGAELNSIRDEQKMVADGESEGENVSAGNQKLGDFAIAVRMTSILDQIEGKKTKFYKINAELIQTTSGEKVWIGDHEIQKTIEQAKAGW
jgi:PBP1b-binding outer membrane lipoprotein LpoB